MDTSPIPATTHVAQSIPDLIPRGPFARLAKQVRTTFKEARMTTDVLTANAAQSAHYAAVTNPHTCMPDADPEEE